MWTVPAAPSYHGAEKRPQGVHSMLVLSVNVGSTSLKYRLYRMEAAETELAHGHFEGVARETGGSRQQAGEHTREDDAPTRGYQDAIEDMLSFLKEAGKLPGMPDCVAFKTVAALGVTGVTRLNEDVLKRMEQLNALLPAHNPPYVAAIRQFMRQMPGTPLIGCFETGFFAGMPPKAYLYPLPHTLTEQGLKRNGAHGASHEYVTGWVTERLRRPVRLISCHLGGSSSLAAVRDGRGADTTIGLSMQTGLPHNNRVGDIDPYLTFYLNETLGMPLKDIKHLYGTQSGLYGLSGGLSGDMRVLTDAYAQGDARAALAVDAFCYQLRKQIGAYVAALGGADAIAFTGGIGQNSSTVRGLALEGLQCMGIVPDENRNQAARPGDDIAADDSPVRIFVVATNEEIIIARKARQLMQTQA